MTMQTRDVAKDEDDDTNAGGEKAQREERFSPAPLRATTACALGDYRLALKVHGHLTDEEIDRVESKHPRVKTYDVAKEIVPRINYLKFLQERNRLGEEDAKEVREGNVRMPFVYFSSSSSLSFSPHRYCCSSLAF